MHECESLPGCGLIDLPLSGNRDRFDAVQSLANDLGFRYATLSGPALQHALVTRFYVDLFPNHY